MLNLQNKRVTVMGLGRFGGGLGATKWFAKQGAMITVTDLNPAEKLKEPLEDIQHLVDAGLVQLTLGGHDERDFAEADLVVANPAVPKPWENRYLLAAERANVPINTEIGLLIDRLPTGLMTIGVTGSVGKSTTTSMIEHTLRAEGFGVLLGGNIGKSLLEMLPIVPTPRTVVLLELSSFMLYWLNRIQKWSPKVAVCTNIAANHLDWHGSMEHYVDCKKALLRHQSPNNVAVLGPELAFWARETKGRSVVVTEALEQKLAVPGAHNRLNAAVALRACLAASPSNTPASISARLTSFPGLEHRLQLCHTSDGKRFYNDSKCTTPEAALKAIESLAEESGGATGHIHLIAGGYDKGADLSSIGTLAPRLAGLYCIGVTGPSIAAHATRGHVETCGTIDEACTKAAARMKNGDVLLLSPACASWDQFINYEFRGKHFISLVQRLFP